MLVGRKERFGATSIEVRFQYHPPWGFASLVWAQLLSLLVKTFHSLLKGLCCSCTSLPKPSLGRMRLQHAV